MTSTSSNGLLRPDDQAHLREQPAQPDGQPDAAGPCSSGWSSSPRERSIGALQRRGLPWSRARPERPPAGGMRRLRAGDLAEHRVQGLRPAGAEDRLGGVPRPRPARAHQGAEAVHDDLLQRPERTARRARAAPRRAAWWSAAGSSCWPTCRCSTPFSSAAASCSSGCARAPVRSASRACSGDFDVHGWCERHGRPRGRAAAARLGVRRAAPRAHRLRPRQPRRRSSASTPT